MVIQQLLEQKTVTKSLLDIMVLSIIQHLEATVQDLTSKIKQFTSFIEAKGLVEAFKEFLNPPKVIEKVKDVRTKLSEYRKAKPKSTPAKKRDSWAR